MDRHAGTGFFNVYTKFKLHFYPGDFPALRPGRPASPRWRPFAWRRSRRWAGRPSASLPLSCGFPCQTPPTRSTAWSKGLYSKKQSQEDQREYHLEVTQKYLDYYSISVTYMVEVMNRISRRFSSEECAKLEEMLRIVSKELMPEVTLPIPELRRTFGRNGPDVRFCADQRLWLYA